MEKLRIFVATVESVLLYGCETWTISVKLETKPDGTYTKLLRKVQNFTWNDKVNNIDLYNGMPGVSEKIRVRRLKLSGHCQRHPEIMANFELLWVPKHGMRKPGRPRLTYVDTLLQDTGLESTEELLKAMNDRKSWREFYL